MIERFGLAAGILVAIVLLGVAVRRWSRWRCERLASARTAGYSNEGLPQILSFYGPGCNACEQQKRIIKELFDTQTGAVSVTFVDAAAEVNMALKFGVMVVPTTVVATATGGIVAITSGLLPPDRLVEQLAEVRCPRLEASGR